MDTLQITMKMKIKRILMALKKKKRRKTNSLRKKLNKALFMMMMKKKRPQFLKIRLIKFKRRKSRSWHKMTSNNSLMKKMKYNQFWHKRKSNMIQMKMLNSLMKSQ